MWAPREILERKRMPPKDKRLLREPNEHIIRLNASYNMKEIGTPYWARAKVQKPKKAKTQKVKKTVS